MNVLDYTVNNQLTLNDIKIIKSAIDNLPEYHKEQFSMSVDNIKQKLDFQYRVLNDPEANFQYTVESMIGHGLSSSEKAIELQKISRDLEYTMVVDYYAFELDHPSYEEELDKLANKIPKTKRYYGGNVNDENNILFTNIMNRPYFNPNLFAESLGNKSYKNYTNVFEKFIMIHANYPTFMEDQYMDNRPYI